MKLVPESDVLIYAMGISSPFPTEDDGPSLLAWIAEQTGGREYSCDFDKLPDIAKQIGLELHNRYVLGFSPASLERDGRYDKVQIKIVRTRGSSETFASWRRGYYAPTD